MSEPVNNGMSVERGDSVRALDLLDVAAGTDALVGANVEVMRRLD
jgi:hypothetical protein